MPTTDRILRACAEAGHRTPDALRLCAHIVAHEPEGCTAEALADFLDRTRPDADDWHYYIREGAPCLARHATAPATPAKQVYQPYIRRF